MKIDEVDKEKFWVLMQAMEPEMTREEFEIEWEDHLKYMAAQAGKSDTIH